MFRQRCHDEPPAAVALVRGLRCRNRCCGVPMTDVPLLKPDVPLVRGGCYTDEQMLAYGKACRNGGLEDAAKLLDRLASDDKLSNYHAVAAHKVRALKGKP